MENTQDFLNALTITLVLAFASLIMLDLFTGLVDLWNQLDNHKSPVQYQLSHKLETQRNITLPYLKIARDKRQGSREQGGRLGWSLYSTLVRASWKGGAFL